MSISFYNIRSLRNILILLLFTGFFLIVGFIFKSDSETFEYTPVKKSSTTYNNLNIIDPDDLALDRNFTCIETKKVFDLYHTNLCLHSKHDTVSETVVISRIWEETDVKRVLSILIRNPGMDMIDIGANIGGFTMFTAGALGRFTLAVECYLPGIERIARAIQLRKATHRVVLVQNAIYSVAGKYLTITTDNPSGIRLRDETMSKNAKNEFVVKTIQFDDLLPILLEHNVRTAMIKIDIETSESYMCETGSKIFDQINIPYVMMEWHSWRVNHQKRYQYVYLTCINPNLIHQILFSCPNLDTFHGIFIGQNHHIVPPTSPYDHPLREFTLLDSHQKLSFETIETLLLYIPDVECLSLQFACKVPFIHLIETMVDSLEHLQSFVCDILETPNHQMASVESIQEMKPCFQPLECFDKDHGYRVFVTE